MNGQTSDIGFGLPSRIPYRAVISATTTEKRPVRTKATLSRSLFLKRRRSEDISFALEPGRSNPVAGALPLNLSAKTDLLPNAKRQNETALPYRASGSTLPFHCTNGNCHRIRLPASRICPSCLLSHFFIETKKRPFRSLSGMVEAEVFSR